MGRPSKQKRVAFSRGSAVISVRVFSFLPYSICSCNDTKFSYPKQTEEPLKVLFLSGIRGSKFISIYNFPVQLRLSFGKPAHLEFGVMARAVRDIN